MLEGGIPDGRAVLVHSGTPNSRLLYEPVALLAERQGIRMICYDRPGYGGSDRDPGRSVASCAQDVRAMADALGIERLGVWGISGGGPHAIACAALLADLVPAVAVLASPAPWGAEGLDYFEGMGRVNVEDWELTLRDRDAGRAKHERTASRGYPRRPRRSTRRSRRCFRPSIGRRSRLLARSSYTRRGGSRWRRVQMDGGTMMWRSRSRGDSSYGRSGRRFFCSTDVRIASCPSPTASGSPGISQASKRGCYPRTATSR